MSSLVKFTVKKWIEKLQSQGKYAFSFQSASQELTHYSQIGLKSALNRLSKKGEILSIYKGFYLIITPQYRGKGILPITLFIDELMNFLGKPYYLGLLNAASLHGASHQQPQEYFVITNFPVLRPTEKNGIKINYISKFEINSSFLEKKKTESGYLKISNPLLTITDLIQFEKRIGGLNRAVTVIEELSEILQLNDFSSDIIHYIHKTVWQRLGYILDKILNNQLLTNILFSKLQEEKIIFNRTSLKSSVKIKGCMTDEKWKIIVNTEIETDLNY